MRKIVFALIVFTFIGIGLSGTALALDSNWSDAPASTVADWATITGDTNIFCGEWRIDGANLIGEAYDDQQRLLYTTVNTSWTQYGWVFTGVTWIRASAGMIGDWVTITGDTNIVTGEWRIDGANLIGRAYGDEQRLLYTTVNTTWGQYDWVFTGVTWIRASAGMIGDWVTITGDTSIVTGEFAIFRDELIGRVYDNEGFVLYKAGNYTWESLDWKLTSVRFGWSIAPAGMIADWVTITGDRNIFCGEWAGVLGGTLKGRAYDNQLRILYEVNNYTGNRFDWVFTGVTWMLVSSTERPDILSDWVTITGDTSIVRGEFAVFRGNLIGRAYGVGQRLLYTTVNTTWERFDWVFTGVTWMLVSSTERPDILSDWVTITGNTNIVSGEFALLPGSNRSSLIIYIARAYDSQGSLLYTGGNWTGLRNDWFFGFVPEVDILLPLPGATVWPPNKVTVTASVSDIDDNLGTINLSATVNGTPAEILEVLAGDDSVDIVVALPLKGRGRYEEGLTEVVAITATDPSGLASSDSVSIFVPHDMRLKNK